MRYETVDLVQKSISGNEPGDNDNMEDQNRSEPLFEDDESVIMEEITKQVVGQETADWVQSASWILSRTLYLTTRVFYSPLYQAAMLAIHDRRKMLDTKE